MSACCDGSLGDSCRCECHDLNAAIPERVKWAAISEAGAIPPGFTYPETWAAMDAWVRQRVIERAMLDHLEAILKARPADAPGVMLIRYPDETVMMESQWIPSGTLIYSMQDQPDLMVKVDPDGPGVLYYRQTKAGGQ